MNRAEYSEHHGRWLAAIPIGLWAAAIAVAPSLTAKALLAAPAVLVPLTWWTLHRPARWVTLFFATAWLLPPLPIRMGDSGPHVCLFFAALGLFSGLLWLSRWRIAPTAPAAALTTLFGVMLASVALAAIHSGAAVAAGSLARVALFGIPVYVFFFTAYGPGAPEGLSHVRILFWIAAASALFACVDFYFQFPAPAGYGPQFVWLDSEVYRRAQGVFYEASTLGNSCAFFLVMIAVAWSRPRAEAPVSRKALAAGGVVFFAALVLSYSRASLINLLVALAVLAWLNRRRIRLRRAAPILAAGVVAGAAATWKVFPAFAEMYWLRLLGSAQYFFSATEGVLSGRLASWRILAAWIAANPWSTLIGVGYKTLPYNDYLGAPVVADNMYLSLLVETGIAGLAAFLWLNVAILRAAARASCASSSRTSFFGAWMLCFWAGQMVQMLSGDLFTYWRVLPVYFWVLALAVRV
jgi:O-antigen ligase